MKRLLIIILIILVLLMSSCGSKEDSSEAKSIENEISSGGEEIKEIEESIEVDENLLNVEITLPASMFEDETFEEVESEAKGNGVKEVVQNDDGSYTYVMSKKQHKVMMEKMKAEFETSLDELLIDYPSVSEVTYNDDFSKFSVFANQDAYESGWDGFIVLALGFTGMMYQQFDGVAEENVEVVITEINEGTMEIFNTVIYPDVLEEMGE